MSTVRSEASRLAFSVAALLAMTAAAALGWGLRPYRELSEELPPVALQQQVPSAFLGWVVGSAVEPVLPDPGLQATLSSVYDQTLARTYVDRQGERVMLTIAYGRDQSSEATAVHRPEFCYGAQGFEVRNAGVAPVALESGPLTVQRLVGTLGSRIEPITYWVTLADRATLPGWGRKWAQLRLGLAGFVADGMLVRVSSLARNPAAAYATQDRFLKDLSRTLPADVRLRYFGGGA